MNDIVIVFDDTNIKSEIIRDVIGEKGFADIVVRKKRLEEYYSEMLLSKYPGAEWFTMGSVFEFNALRHELEQKHKEDTRVIHCFSSFFITDKEKVLLSFEKLKFIDDANRMVCDGKLVAVIFPDRQSYDTYLKDICGGKTSMEAAKGVRDYFCMDGVVDIGVVGNFIQCITGNFDSRYFNSLQGNEYIIVKSSKNKKKIKSEYQYYQLLPEDMRFWFVMPFSYEEDDEKASYTMERLHVTDLAVKWVHGSIDESEFEMILDKYFYFFRSRHRRMVDKKEYDRISDALYIDKVKKRVDELKICKEYSIIAKLVEAGCEEKAIEVLLDRYFWLKTKVEKRVRYPLISVIGHGDPCFANTLYNKSTRMLKFIDPRGALTEEELWTDPYYDIAKLSHSICGRYDFFNSALFDIRINEKFQYELHIDFDNTKYMEIFKNVLEKNGYDYLTVRLYEASLFLSMLPLHIDYPYKVFGFILNVSNILEEIGKYV
ncbi:MAG: hypothetical protein HFH75_00840 [Lachnospiraceae bacterium]|jgi:hypothetical protein|nr:hypothetical protein [Lachnospiraceae bacterium]MCI8966117.1 hypothetical protein [Lachnospiraceae bacterium]